MNTYIAILRGINVGGHRKIKMTDLKQLFEKAGLEKVTTYIQSGNVVFKSSESNRSQLSAQLEKAIESDYGFHVTVIIKSLSEWENILQKFPFENPDEKKLLVTYLKNPPEPANLEKFRQFDAGTDEFLVEGDVLYLHCPGGYGLTKLSNDFIERQLKVSASTRNIRSAKKILEMAREMAG